MGKVNSHSTAIVRLEKLTKNQLNTSLGKSIRKHKHYEIMCFLNISHEAKIHTVSITWEKSIPIVRENYAKRQIFQSKGMGFIHISKSNIPNLRVS